MTAASEGGWSEPAATTFPITAEYIEKKSRFAARLYRIDSREQAQEALAQTAAEESSAGHHCFAWIAGDPRQPLAIHCGDDGEPSGTAGRPMLAVLTGAELGNVLVVVSRWFGGIKLGTGGLVRAYSQAARQVVEAAQFVPFVAKVQLQLQCGWSEEQVVRRLVEQCEGVVTGQEYGEAVHFTLQLAEARREAFCAGLQEATAGRVAAVEVTPP